MKSKTLKALCALSMAIVSALILAMSCAGGAQATGSSPSKTPGLMGFD
jgi:hypothetical protein